MTTCEALTAAAVADGLTAFDLADRDVRRALSRSAGVPAPASGPLWREVAAALTAATKRSRPRLGSCRLCGAPVRWVKTSAADRAMPLDPLPTRRGNVSLEDTHGGRSAIATVHASPPAGVPLYRSHFATCPQAGKTARRRGTITGRCRVGVCTYAVASRDGREVSAALAAHYRSEHLDRCDACGTLLVWARDAVSGGILALDVAVADAPSAGLWRRMSGGKARRVEPGETVPAGVSLLVPHSCGAGAVT